LDKSIEKIYVLTPCLRSTQAFPLSYFILTLPSASSPVKYKNPVIPNESDGGG
jgi:hypothetical protein